MRVTPAPDLPGRLDVVVDHDAAPVDFDEVLAEFLIAYERESEGSER